MSTPNSTTPALDPGRASTNKKGHFSKYWMRYLSAVIVLAGVAWFFVCSGDPDDSGETDEAGDPSDPGDPDDSGEADDIDETGNPDDSGEADDIDEAGEAGDPSRQEFSSPMKADIIKNNTDIPLEMTYRLKPQKNNLKNYEILLTLENNSKQTISLKDVKLHCEKGPLAWKTKKNDFDSPNLVIEKIKHREANKTIEVEFAFSSRPSSIPALYPYLEQQKLNKMKIKPGDHISMHLVEHKRGIARKTSHYNMVEPLIICFDFLEPGWLWQLNRKQIKWEITFSPKAQEGK